MLPSEIELLNGKKKKKRFFDIFTEMCFEFVDGFAHFFKEGNYSNFPATLRTVIIGYCS